MKIMKSKSLQMVKKALEILDDWTDLIISDIMIMDGRFHKLVKENITLNSVPLFT
jgi:hypothetical protein